ncbi:43758_t:CDS:2, partial [Gigaspora margarita]
MNVASKLDQKKRPLAANTGSKQKADVVKREYQTTQKIGAVQIIPLHEISQSLKNIDNVLNEYNKFKDLLQNCQSPISRLTNVQRLFGRKLLASMKRLPKISSRLNIQQEKIIDEILTEMQNGLFYNKFQISELGWIVKYLYEELRYDGLIEPNDIINEGLWAAEPIHVIITAISHNLNKLLPQ